MTVKAVAIKKSTANAFYSHFDQLNGQHPWMEVLPQGYVGYRVRELRTGEVAYFNYVLAKEMGLISADHPHEMNNELKNKLIETFSIQIINEYDELTKKRINPATIKPHMYMATRYLQLQHHNKQGKTSGDGRSIWNGIVKHRGKIWDVSSRGTGVTCLAPGAVEANKPLATGKGEFGYGCGQAEIDELYGAAIMAETMHLQGLSTERMLAIIDLGNGYGIGIRAAPNLIRPAHLFMYLKQDRLKELRSAFHFVAQRQVQNGEWKIDLNSKNFHDEAGLQIAKSFGGFAARLEIDYIFAWLDWDGDNVLCNAGIIDYGSVRQFGARHDKYRYDDVERFSTNLNEQKVKARLLVQVFAQMIDYLKTGQKKSLRRFANHEMIKSFNREFELVRNDRLLCLMGFTPSQRDRIAEKGQAVFNEFYKAFSYFETAKISGSPQKVADGVNHPPVYQMRTILRTLPRYFTLNLQAFEKGFMPEEMFFKTILTNFAKAKDARIGEKQKRRISSFINQYKELVLIGCGKNSPHLALKGIAERASKLNSDQRITGNALIQIVDQLIQEIKKGMPRAEVQNYIDKIVISHLGLPEVHVSKFYDNVFEKPVRRDVYSRILKLVSDYQHDI